jgi:integrase
MVRFSLETGLGRSNVLAGSCTQRYRNCLARLGLVRMTEYSFTDSINYESAVRRAKIYEPMRCVGSDPPATNRDQSSRGKPVRQVNTKAWRASLKRVGIEDFRWHDLRHTWASWHVQAGTPLYVLQELGSWECVEMVRKYAHIASDHLVQYVDRMSGLRVVQDGKVATFPATAAK